MKIAYVGNNQSSSFKRALAYAKNEPSSTHHFYMVRETEPGDMIPALRHGALEYFEYIAVSELQERCYDIALNMNDKYFHKALIFNEHGGQTNLAKKDQLFRAAKPLLSGNITLPKQGDFKDTDLVFVKPTYSSGCYDSNIHTYKHHTFKDVKNLGLDTDKNQIAEFIDTDDTVILYFVTNGKGDVHNIDVVEQEYISNSKGIPMVVFNETNLINKSEYKELIEFCLDLIKQEKYNFLQAFFSIQFLIKDGKFYLIDFNTRTGPASLAVELSGKMSSRLFNYLPFMAGKVEFDKLEIPQNNGFIHYSTSAYGDVLTSRKIIKNHPQLFSFDQEKKSTGLSNSETYAFAYPK